MDETIKIVCCPDCEGLPILKLVSGEIGLQCQDCKKEFQMDEAIWKYMIVEVK
jgi:uncharacterized protein YbaR (Trm112 family)